MNSNQIEFAVKEIKELEFFAKEDVNLHDAFDLNYHVDISVRAAIEAIVVSVAADYLVKEDKTLFMKGRTATTFLIRNMANYSKKINDKEAIDLPDSLWITMFSVAFSHARALLAKSSSGTRYGHMLMPLINPEQEFYKLFGPTLAKLKAEVGG